MMREISSEITLPVIPEEKSAALSNTAGDDREFIRAGDRVVLIVENDPVFAGLMLETARAKGFKGLVTAFGAYALGLIQDFKPEAVFLDIHLADMEGWRVLERMKNDIVTRHIPVCVISTDDARERAFEGGAFAFAAKPVQSRDVLERMLENLNAFVERGRNLLLVGEAAAFEGEIAARIAADDLDVSIARDLKAAQKHIRKRRPDGIVITPAETEIALKIISGAAGEFSRLPVIVHGEGDFDPRSLGGEALFYRTFDALGLADAAVRCLHRNILQLPESAKKEILDLHQSPELLAGRKVLIVDDDTRNIFAIASVLEDHNMAIASADNGRDAINILNSEPDIDIVLMDIMMPEMDGMETIREIRKISRFRNLPIVAITAKAMKGDREKCIEAGAWDYLSKPIDTDKLITMLRVWLRS